MQINTTRSPLELIKGKIEYFLDTFNYDVSEGAGLWSKWLTPGLSIKRWLGINVLGILLIIWGLASFPKLTLIIHVFTVLVSLQAKINNSLLDYLISTLILILGICLMFWGQARAMKSITSIIKPEGDQRLVDILLCHHRLRQGAKIVAIGGGTGLSSLLRGLKQHSNNLTAIVTVADDGGSSGRLREELGVLPPGDIRNCIAALSKEESLLTELFQYRFHTGNGLKGHSFGNLFLTAMSEITGNLEKAIAASAKVLAIQGEVLPATLSDVRLWAELEHGQIVEGESKIAAAKGKINKIGCIPANPKALPASIKAIESANCIILGSGSLYTSIIPNLLVPEIRDAIANAKVPRIYVCNIMTQPGETDGYTVSDHIKAIDQACGQRLFDVVVVNGQALSPQAIAKYAQENSHPVVLDSEKVTSLGRQIILTDVLDEDRYTHSVRHNSSTLARKLNSLYN